MNTRGVDEQVLSLTLRGVVRNDPDDPEGLVPSDYNSYQIFEAQDLVFKLIDLENRRTSRVGFVPERGIMSPAYIRLVPRPGVVPRYGYWYFYSLWARNIFNELGGGVRATLGPGDLLALPISLPPVEEQRRIADFLDDQVARIDDLVAYKRDQIDRTSELLTACLSVEMGGAKSLPLRRVVAVWIDYRGATPTKTDSGVQLITAGNIVNGAISFDQTSEFISEKDYWSWMRRGFPEEGDVLFTTEAPLGQVAILERTDVALAQRVILMRPDPTFVSSEWLYWALRSPEVQAEIRAQATGSTAAGIKAARLRGVEIPVPDETRQASISSWLGKQAIESAERTSLLKSSVELLEERKRAVITAAVTGELDVTTARPIGVGKWVPNIGASVDSVTAAQAHAPNIGGIG